MARDLIPPPSPAGKATTPGGVPNLIELPPEPPRSGAQPAQQATYAPSAFRNRFGFLVGALGGVFVAAALVAGIVIWQRSGDPAEEAGLAKNWSKWHPADASIEGGSAEIARKVGAEYKQDNGKQLVLVEANPITDDGNGGLHVALVPSSGNITQINGRAVVYELNGLGPNMSILGGKPSPQRLQVLHREALELSLYTFRYLPDVEMVVVMLPPPPPDAKASSTASALGTAAESDQCAEKNGFSPCKSALFYRPGDLKLQLQVPLGATVPAKAPTPESLGAAEGKSIDSLTLPNKFLWRLQQDRGLLVLGRP
jgi:hypothetical protein